MLIGLSVLFICVDLQFSILIRGISVLRWNLGIESRSIPVCGNSWFTYDLAHGESRRSSAAVNSGEEERGLSLEQHEETEPDRRSALKVLGTGGIVGTLALFGAKLHGLGAMAKKTVSKSTPWQLAVLSAHADR